MSTERTAGLADVLFGRTRGAILALLYGHADESFYTRQIAREVNASVGAIQRELETLAKIGLIKRSSVGNQVFYQVNKDAPVFPEMRGLVNKTVGAISVLRRALEPISHQIVVAFIYGSVAREEETAESDIDLMIIGKAELESVVPHLSGVEKTLGRAINPTAYSAAEFRSKLVKGNHFLNTVIKAPKVFLMGGDDDLGKMGRVRVGKTPAHKSR